MAQNNGPVWRQHSCCFYATKQDLLDVLAAYFKDGLEHDESCLWLISDPLSKEDAQSAMRQVVPNLDRYEAASSMEFLPYDEWYLKGGAFDTHRIIHGWHHKLGQVLARGHAGLRISGDTGWVKKKNWKVLLDYENMLDRSLPDERMRVLCTFPVVANGASDLLDVAHAHRAVAARRNGKWEMLETAQVTQAMERITSLSAANERLRGEITERETVENELKKQKEILQKIFDHIPVMIRFADDKDRIKLVNREWERTLGWTLEEIQRQSLDIFAACYPDPEYRQKVLDFVSKSDGEWVNFKPRVRDGRVIDTNWIVVRLSDGTSFGMGRDITDRTRTEEALREAQESFRQLTENIEELFWVKTPDFRRLLYLSPNYDRVAGISRERHLEADGVQFLLDLIHPEDRASMADIIRRADGREFEIEFRLIAPDGSVRWIRERGFPIHDQSGKVDLIAGISENITGRKLAEEALRESEERFRQLAENIRELFWIKTPDFKQVLYLSPSYESVTGRDREARCREQGFQSFLEMIHPEDRAGMAEIMYRADGQEFEIEFRITMPDGSLRWIHDHGFPIRDHSGQVYRIAGIAQNVTDRKLAEERLKATSEQLRALSASLQSAREEERARIAREIHDELGSSLTSLKWDLEGLGKSFSEPVEQSQPAAMLEQTASMMKLTDTIIHSVRRIASELRPSILDDIGLVDAIEWQAQQFQARTGIAFHSGRALETAHLNKEQSTAVFRIFQETLTNVIRHAQATKVDILMREQEGMFVLTIVDNGRGITDGEKSGKLSLGLLGMQERAHLVGGNVNIRAVKPNGTVVTVEVPTSGGLK